MVRLCYTPTAVIGLGFGDEGKGMAVAHECGRIINVMEQVPMVVRFNGGPQAAHNVRVERDGRILHHVHSQIGSGAMLGARTVLAKGMLVDPLALENEAMAFARLMNDPIVLSKVYLDRRCPVVIPSHVDVNRTLERMRGDGRHGSTGRGIGVARKCEAHAMESGVPVLTFGTLLEQDALTKQIAYWRQTMQDVYGIRFEWSVDDRTEALILHESAVDLLRHLINLVDDSQRLVRDEIDEGGCVVFEGSQGMLLDERYGWFPHVTYGDMTPAGATELAGCPIRVLGVTRSYQTRHGAGPMPTEYELPGDYDLSCDYDEPDNEWSEWAGGMRTGLLDLKTTARMAREICADEIAISCLDRFPGHWVRDYKYDSVSGVMHWDIGHSLTYLSLVREVADACGAPVRVLGMGNTLSDWKDI